MDDQVTGSDVEPLNSGMRGEGLVLVFGTFDLLHRGHHFFLEHAKAQGASLLVVVTRDAAVAALKGNEPEQDEKERLAQLQALTVVDEARLGEVWPPADPYGLLRELEFDVLALGYDQRPADEAVREELAKRGKEAVRVVRITALRPDRYKSSLLRSQRL